MTEHDALLKHTTRDFEDRTAMAVFADWLQDHNLPNAHAFRARADRGAAKRLRNYTGTYTHTHSVQDGEGNSWRGVHGPNNFLVVEHAPDDKQQDSRRIAVPVHSKEDARQIISDMPQEVKQMYEEQLIPHLPDESPAKLARPDVRKLNDYWSFLNQLADKQDAGEPLDRNAAGAFADWLDEHNKPTHAMLLRKALYHNPYQSSLPAVPQEHPAHGPPVEGLRDWLGSVRHQHLRTPQRFYTSDFIHRPAHDLAHDVATDSGAIKLLNHRRGWSDPPANAPTILWSAHIPAAVSTAKRMREMHVSNIDKPLTYPVPRTVHFTAPLTADELHDFVFTMPKSRTRATWQRAAEAVFGKISGAAKLARPAGLGKAFWLKPSGEMLPVKQYHSMTAHDLDPNGSTGLLKKGWWRIAHEGDIVHASNPFHALSDKIAKAIEDHALEHQASEISIEDKNRLRSIYTDNLERLSRPSEQGGGRSSNSSENIGGDLAALHTTALTDPSAMAPYIDALQEHGLTGGQTHEKLPEHHPTLIAMRTAHSAEPIVNSTMYQHAARGRHAKAVNLHTKASELADSYKRLFPQHASKWSALANAHRVAADWHAYWAKQRLARTPKWVRFAGRVRDVNPELLRTGKGKKLAENITQYTDSPDSHRLVYSAGDEPIAAMRLGVKPDNSAYVAESYTKPAYRGQQSHIKRLLAVLKDNYTVISHPRSNAAVVEPAVPSPRTTVDPDVTNPPLLAKRLVALLSKYGPLGRSSAQQLGNFTAQQLAAAHKHAEEAGQLIAEKVKPAKGPHATWFRLPDQEPAKLARVRTGGQAAGVADKLSSNHAARVILAKRVLSETGLLPATVRSVLSHTDERGVRPGVLAAIHKEVPDELLHYAASWLGMLTGEKRLTTFRPGAGNDSLHIIDTPAKQQDVGEYLRRMGAQFSLDSSGGGTRALLVNPTIDTSAAARGLSGTVKSLTGTAKQLGSGDDSDARARYRHTISKTEQSAGVAPGPTGVLQ